MTSPPSIISAAVASGVNGDRDGGLNGLFPLIAEGPGTTFGVLSTLAELAATPARPYPQGVFHGIVVDHIDTGEQGSVDDLPHPIRFAAQFTTAHANRDTPQIIALWRAFLDRCLAEENDDIGHAVAALYDMAVSNIRDLAERGRLEQALKARRPT